MDIPLIDKYECGKTVLLGFISVQEFADIKQWKYRRTLHCTVLYSVLSWVRICSSKLIYTLWQDQLNCFQFPSHHQKFDKKRSTCNNRKVETRMGSSEKDKQFLFSKVTLKIASRKVNHKNLWENILVR